MNQLKAGVLWVVVSHGLSRAVRRNGPALALRDKLGNLSPMQSAGALQFRHVPPRARHHSSRNCRLTSPAAALASGPAGRSHPRLWMPDIGSIARCGRHLPRV